MGSSYTFSLSCIGASHILRSLPCQDFALNFEGENYKLLCLSDGHGGEDYCRSEKGSQIAAVTASKVFKQMVEASENSLNNFFVDTITKKSMTDAERNKRLYQLTRSIVLNWRKEVENDVKEHPFTSEELIMVSKSAREQYLSGRDVFGAYGSTFLFSVITPSYWFAIQIGDGDIICFDKEGKAVKPVPEDPRCIGNLTTSISAIEAVQDARFFSSYEIPVAIFLTSDGITKSYDETNPKLFEDFFRKIICEFALSSNCATTLKELEEKLPIMFKEGSGDDISIAGAIDLDFVKENMNLFRRTKDLILHIERKGNYGAKTNSDSYEQSANILISAAPMNINLLVENCGGFWKGVNSVEVKEKTNDFLYALSMAKN